MIKIIPESVEQRSHEFRRKIHLCKKVQKKTAIKKQLELNSAKLHAVSLHNRKNEAGKIFYDYPSSCIINWIELFTEGTGT